MSWPGLPVLVMLADRPVILLGHGEVRAAMGSAARSRVRRTYPESAMIDGFARAAGTARDRARWRR